MQIWRQGNSAEEHLKSTICCVERAYWPGDGTYFALDRLLAPPVPGSRMVVEVPQLILRAIEMPTQVLNAPDVETLQCSEGCIVDHIRNLSMYNCLRVAYRREDYGYL